MSESLRNDGRVWVPKKQGDSRPPEQIPEEERDYYLERKYPSFGNLVPRDVASRNAKQACDDGRGVGESGLAVYLDFKDAIKRVGPDVIREKYGNLFQMYQKITDEDPYEVPMRIYPAIHYTMGGLWVDYNLMSTVPGLARPRRGELLGSRRKPARRQRADAGAGRRLLRHPVHDRPVPGEHAAAEGHYRSRRVQGCRQQRAAAHQHAAVGEGQPEHPGDSPRARTDHVGRRRDGAHRGQPDARARRDPASCARSSGTSVSVPGSPDNLNQSLEYAGRVADYLEFAELLALDALQRKESCGGHFREESQTPEGEALRDDEHYSYVAAWEFTGVGTRPELHKEPLEFEEVHPTQRSYK